MINKLFFKDVYLKRFLANCFFNGFAFESKVGLSFGFMTVWLLGLLKIGQFSSSFLCRRVFVKSFIA